MTFPSTNPALDRALVAKEYVTPTAVQLAVLDANATGRDLLVSAQTGSGKTVAFGMAMASTLLGQAERFERAAEPMALIIAPTRELAMQVQRELVWLYAETGARVVTCVGGMDARAEARQLNFGAHIVVGTPGRLRDHLERKRLDLTKLKTIVLDEADEMLDLGFREDLEFILDATPESRQTLLFSATMPRDIEMLAKRYQREAVRIETTSRNEQHADIEYRALRVAPHDTENAVVNVLRFYEARSTLVFCTTREAVKRMQARLLERGFSAVALSGELTQNERTQALSSLRDGRARVLVATDVAARGLDLPDLALVIHAELPHDHETLLHRSGRTGRAGKKGMCVLIVPGNRRRKAEMLLGGARLKVTWAVAPSADEIRTKDQERFLADAIFSDVATDAETALVASLQAGRTADEIALALVRIHKTRLPEPEDLVEDTGPPRRDDRGRTGARPERFERPAGDGPRKWERADRGERGESAERPERPAFAERAPRAPRREDTREMVWFRLNIGRERNADPKWILPLICKAGGISKSEIGSIKIHDRDTRFQIVADQADQFADAVRNNKNKEGHISRVGAQTSEDDAAVTTAIKALPTASVKPDAHRADTRRVDTRSDERPADPAAARERPKAPWRDRAKSSAGPRTFADKKKGPRDDRDRGPPKDRPATAAAAPGAKSKYQHKKKQRQATPAAS
jgi:ATP-dependent RNA helicase DeaD